MSFLRRDYETAPRPTVSCGEGKTKSNMKDDTDINLIMKKYKKTGVVDFVSNNEAKYMDAEPVDFHQAMTIIAESEQLFASMPAHLRKQFRNDPGEFLDFVHDENNTDALIEMGLATAPEGYTKPNTAEAQPEAKTGPGEPPEAT